MRADVVELILKDHRELEKLFDTLLNEPDKRVTLVPLMTTFLTAHSRAEESEVYPAAKEAGGQEDVEHSQKEHLAADQLALDLSSTDFDSDDFPKKLKELIDAVKHHVEEEETTVLPGMLRNIGDDRRAKLGEAFLRVRAQHLGKQPTDITKAELEQQAANIDLPGASQTSKDDLKAQLASEADL